MRTLVLLLFTLFYYLNYLGYNLVFNFCAKDS